MELIIAVYVIIFCVWWWTGTLMHMKNRWYELKMLLVGGWWKGWWEGKRMCFASHTYFALQPTATTTTITKTLSLLLYQSNWFLIWFSLFAIEQQSQWQMAHDTSNSALFEQQCMYVCATKAENSFSPLSQFVTTTKTTHTHTHVHTYDDNIHDYTGWKCERRHRAAS